MLASKVSNVSTKVLLMVSRVDSHCLVCCCSSSEGRLLLRYSEIWAPPWPSKTAPPDVSPNLKNQYLSSIGSFAGYVAKFYDARAQGRIIALAPNIMLTVRCPVSLPNILKINYTYKTTCLILV